MGRNTDPLTYNQTVRGILEFLQAAFHTILYVRRVYPPETFERKKKFDAPVYQSRSPDVREFLDGALKAIAEDLPKGIINRILFIIKDKHDVCLERFVFDITIALQVPALWQRDDSVEKAMLPAVLAQYFRSFLGRLSQLENMLGQLDDEDEITFAIIMEPQPGMVPSAPKGKNIDDPPPWVPAVVQHTSSGLPDEESELHIVRAVETGIINIALTIQDTEEKLKRMKDR